MHVPKIKESFKDSSRIMDLESDALEQELRELIQRRSITQRRDTFRELTVGATIMDSLGADVLLPCSLYWRGVRWRDVAQRTVPLSSRRGSIRSL